MAEAQPAGPAGQVLTVMTVPPLGGVRFSLGDRVLVTGEDGVTTASVAGGRTYSVEVQPSAPGLEGTRAFVMWDDGTFERRRRVQVGAEPRTLQAGFEVAHTVTFTFVDSGGRPIAAERIEGLRLRGSQGHVYDLDRIETGHLQTNRIVRRLTGLESIEVQYSVEEVIVDGSNVVNRGQQRHAVRAGEPWRIELLLFSARFSARDAVFGTPIGSGIHLEYPDGRSRYVPFDSHSELALDALARGIYRVRVESPGFSPVTPVAVTRDQEVSLIVVSRLDMALAAALAVSLGIGLLLAGRPHLARVFFPRTRRGRGAEPAGPRK